MKTKIRIAQFEELTAIVSVYNEAIRAAYQTADLEELSTNDRTEWFEKHQHSNYALFVLLADELIIGWLSLSPYRMGRSALSKTVEISYYLSSEFQGKGLGNQLMAFGIEEAKKRNFHHLIAILLSANKKSISLLQKFGFAEWGRMPRIAVIKKEFFDHLYFGLHINSEK